MFTIYEVDHTNEGQLIPIGETYETYQEALDSINDLTPSVYEYVVIEN